jgi:septal ring factor EnvC (AmiA/AmiB activator)
MQQYSDKIPKKVIQLIEKDIERLGKAIERDPDKKVKLAKLIKKLDKDAMKIGEAIYANVDQKND